VNLYINTSEPYCQIALFKEGEVLAHATYQKTMQHSTVLHDMIQELLHQNNSSFKNLTCITVLNGPGSYTGLRVGLAAAKGFCYSMEIPLILLNKLNLLSEQYLYQNKEINKVACIMAARMCKKLDLSKINQKKMIFPT
jgi:tRNA threonylcarbamoyladenosine biosynthesis protein TsaB